MVFRFGSLVLAMVICTSHGRGEDPKPADLNSIRSYVPIPQLEERFGKDIEPLAKYIEALKKRTAELLAKETKCDAKGLLIAVGIKSKKVARVWCEAVEGQISAELLKTLETELAKIEAVDLLKAPAAFAMEIKLFGRKPDMYPEFPKSWTEAAKKLDSKPIVPPDDLFRSLWPD